MIYEIIIGIMVSYFMICVIKILHFFVFGLLMHRILQKYGDDLYFKLGYWIYNLLNNETKKYQHPYTIGIIKSE